MKSTATLNKTVAKIPLSQATDRDALITTRGDRNELRSQRSASCDDRSAVPFSVNESELVCGELQDVDSARASIADWVEIFNESQLGFDKFNMLRPIKGQNSDQFAIEFEFSEI